MAIDLNPYQQQYQPPSEPSAPSDQELDDAAFDAAIAQQEAEAQARAQKKPDRKEEAPQTEQGAAAPDASAVPNNVKRRPLDFDPQSCTADLFLSERPKDPPMVFDGLPRGCLGALVAPPGSGKSTFVAQMLATYADGGALFGKWHTDSPKRSIFLSVEDPYTTIQQRIYDALQGVLADRRKAAAELICVPEVHGHVTLFNVINGLLHPTIEFSDLKKVTEAFKPDLIVLDTLSRFCGGVEGDNSLMAAACSYLEELACEYMLSVIVLHHNSKSSGGTLVHKEADAYGLLDPYASRGATALTGSIRWQMNLAPLSADYATTWIGDSAKGKPDGMYVVGRVCKKNIGVPEGRVYFVHSGMTGMLERVEPLSDEVRNKAAYEDVDKLVEIIKTRKMMGMDPVAASRPQPDTQIFWGPERMKKAVTLGEELGLIAKVKKSKGNGKVLALVEDLPPKAVELVQGTFSQDVRKSSEDEKSPENGGADT